MTLLAACVAEFVIMFARGSSIFDNAVSIYFFRAFYFKEIQNFLFLVFKIFINVVMQMSTNYIATTHKVFALLSLRYYNGL